jgi:hypothetical protein
MTLYENVKDLINSLPNTLREKNSYEFLTYINEFRTLDLSVPRRAGKTHTIQRLAKERSALVCCTNGIMSHENYGGTAYTNIESITRNFRGLPKNNMRLNCLLIDERDSNIDFNMLLTLLYTLDKVTDDFFVLRLGTNRR